MGRGFVRRAGWIALLLPLALVASGCFYHRNVPWDAGPMDDPTITQTFRVGPFSLAGINEPGWEIKASPNSMPKPAGNFAIKKMDFHVVSEHGHHVGLHLVHLHHIVMLDNSQPDPICPSGGTRFAGTGAERTPLVLLGDYAYLAQTGDTWGSTFHLHTTTDTPVEDVYIEYDVTYERVTDPSDFRDVTPYFMDVTGCWSNSGSLYDIPGGGGSGSTHVASATYTAPADGTAVYAGGHFHAGGRNLSLTRNATGEDYCTAKPTYDPDGGHPRHENLGQLIDISSCLMHSEVNAGESFTLRSRYDNEFPVLKAMGIMIVYVWHPSG